VQYLVAPSAPPHLTATIPEFAPASVTTTVAPRGARLSFNLAWAILLANDNVRHYPSAGRSRSRNDRSGLRRPDEGANIQPLYRDCVSRTSRSWTVFSATTGSRISCGIRNTATLAAHNFHTQHQQMGLLMLHVGGWYDTFLQGTIDSYTGFGESDDRRRQAQKPCRPGST
jgi:predicted acyl esterase